MDIWKKQTIEAARTYSSQLGPLSLWLKKVDDELHIAADRPSDAGATGSHGLAERSEPAPLILLQNFGDLALEFLFAVWSTKDDYLKLKKTIRQEIKERFDAEGIEIPFPHRTLYTGSQTEPMPIRIVGGETDRAD